MSFLFLFLFFVFTPLCAQVSIDHTPDESMVEMERKIVDAMKEKILGNTDEAIAKFTELIQKNPDQALLHFQLADLYYQSKQISKATPHIYRAIELKPGELDFVSLLAQMSRQIGAYDKVAQQYDILLEKHPEVDQYYDESIFFWERAGQMDMAGKTLEKKQNRFGYNASILSQKLKNTSTPAKEKKVILEAEDFLKKNPKEESCLWILYEYYVNKSEVQQARKYLDQLLQRNPVHVKAGQAILDSYLAEKDTLRYIQSVEKLIASTGILPYEKAAYLKKLQTSIQNDPQKFGKQVQQLSSLLLQMHPQSKEVQMTVGMNYFYLKQMKEAADLLFALYEFERNNLEFWLALQQSLYHSASLEKMILSGLRMAEFFPDQALGQLYKGYAKLLSKDPLSAQRSFKRAADMLQDQKEWQLIAQKAYELSLFQSEDPKWSAEQLQAKQDASVFARFNWVWLHVHKADDAYKLESLLADASWSSSIQKDFSFLWAVHLVQQKQFEQAKTILEKTDWIKFQPHYADMFGDILMQLNQKTEAIKYWNKAKELGLRSDNLNQKIENAK
jgi:predicted Zn-dependent protease